MVPSKQVRMIAMQLLGRMTHTPSNHPQDCYLLVDNQVARHEDGEVIIFDATYTHSATNDSDEVRIVCHLLPPVTSSR